MYLGLHSNTMGDVSIGMQLHLVHGYLKKELRPVTSAEVKSATGVDIEGSSEILASLSGKGSGVLREPDGRWRWKSKYYLNNQKDLESLLIRSPLGVVEKDLLDSYKGVKEALDRIKNADEPIVYVVKDKSRNILYPREKKLELNISDDVKAKWLSVSLPDPLTIHRYLVDKGLKESSDTAGLNTITPIIRKRPAKKKKKRRRNVKLTNVHMVGSGIDLTRDLNVGTSAFDG